MLYRDTARQKERGQPARGTITVRSQSGLSQGSVRATVRAQSGLVKTVPLFIFIKKL